VVKLGMMATDVDSGLELERLYVLTTRLGKVELA